MDEDKTSYKTDWYWYKSYSSSHRAIAEWMPDRGCWRVRVEKKWDDGRGPLVQRRWQTWVSNRDDAIEKAKEFLVNFDHQRTVIRW